MTGEQVRKEQGAFHDPSVAQAFQPAGFGDFPVPRTLRNWKVPPPADRNVCATSWCMLPMRALETVETPHDLNNDAGILRPIHASNLATGRRQHADPWPQHVVANT